MPHDKPRFVNVWRRDPSMMMTINAAAIASVNPYTNDDGEFDGSVIMLMDGTRMHVDESTKTITARLGVSPS